MILKKKFLLLYCLIRCALKGTKMFQIQKQKFLTLRQDCFPSQPPLGTPQCTVTALIGGRKARGLQEWA